MSLSRNILASYASQVYVTLIGIVIVPLYIKYMGPEAYGLVGFYTMLQSWFLLLDMGLTPTMARETARFRGGASDATGYRRLVRTLEGIFLLVALIGVAGLLASSKYVAQNWLQASELSAAEVQDSLVWMALIVALRWMSGLYRSAISGSERLVWLGSYNATIATVRFVAVVPVLIYVGATPSIFFAFQCLAAVVELAGLVFQAYKLLPVVDAGSQVRWSWAPLRPVLKFSLTIAFTSAVWVIATQTDKLVLSKVLPLADYGYYSVAVLLAGGVLMTSGPVSSALMPRMAKLEAESDYGGVIRVYRHSTQLIAVIAGTASITAALCAESLLWAWTGDQSLARHAAPILQLYSVGNGLVAVSAFPYYLQYAKGDLSLHLIGNAAFVLVLLPTVIWAANSYGSVGAGAVWLSLNLLTFVAWLPFVHRRFVPGLNVRWYCEDIASVVVPGVLAGYGIWMLLPRSDNRVTQLAYVFLVALCILTTSASASAETRRAARAWLAKQRQVRG